MVNRVHSVLYLGLLWRDVPETPYPACCTHALQKFYVCFWSVNNEGKFGWITKYLHSFHSGHFLEASYLTLLRIPYKFVSLCNWPVMKGMLLNEQNTFSAVFQVQLEGCPSRDVLLVATSVTRRALYMKNKVPPRLYLGFMSRDVL